MLKIAAIAVVLNLLQATGVNSGGFVIDPGHSPKSPGATSCTGKSEYLYNFELTASVIAHLSSRKIPAALTRQVDQELSLTNRAKLAKEATLLLSIHHDSVQSQFITWKNGHPSSDRAEGFSIFVSSQNTYYKQSLRYAQCLGTALHARGLQPSLHHAEKIAGENRKLLDSQNGIYLFDDLVILKKTEAPAILFEAAVLVHPRDEARAASELYQSQIAGAITEMLECGPVADK